MQKIKKGLAIYISALVVLPLIIFLLSQLFYSNNTPRFMSTFNYIKLFIKDPLFLTAVKNSFLGIMLAICITVSVLIVVKKLVLDKKLHKINLYFYGGLFIILGVMVVMWWISASGLFGFPSSEYTAASLVNPPEFSFLDVIFNFDSLICMGIMMEFAIFVCMIGYIADGLTTKN